MTPNSIAGSRSGRVLTVVLIAACSIPAVAVIGGTILYAYITTHTITISPDISFRLVCEDNEPTTLAADTAEFFRRNGLTVHNKGPREVQPKGTFLLDEVVGIDGSGRIASLSYQWSGSRSIILRSRPPTHHDTALEDDFIAFGEGMPGCRVRQVFRATNGPEGADFHDRLVAQELQKFPERPAFQ